MCVFIFLVEGRVHSSVGRRAHNRRKNTGRTARLQTRGQSSRRSALLKTRRRWLNNAPFSIDGRLMNKISAQRGICIYTRAAGCVSGAVAQYTRRTYPPIHLFSPDNRRARTPSDTLTSLDACKLENWSSEEREQRHAAGSQVTAPRDDCFASSRRVKNDLVESA